jgi:hypothetical protein
MNNTVAFMLQYSISRRLMSNLLFITLISVYSTVKCTIVQFAFFTYRQQYCIHGAQQLQLVRETLQDISTVVRWK